MYHYVCIIANILLKSFKYILPYCKVFKMISLKFRQVYFYDALYIVGSGGNKILLLQFPESPRSWLLPQMNCLRFSLSLVNCQSCGTPWCIESNWLGCWRLGEICHKLVGAYVLLLDVAAHADPKLALSGKTCRIQVGLSQLVHCNQIWTEKPPDNIGSCLSSASISPIVWVTS